MHELPVTNPVEYYPTKLDLYITTILCTYVWHEGVAFYELLSAVHTVKDADFDLHCASFCAALCFCQYNSCKQH